jgi:hypothetical protein
MEVHPAVVHCDVNERALHCIAHAKCLQYVVVVFIAPTLDCNVFGQTNGTNIEEPKIWRQGRGKEREGAPGPE